MRDILQKLADRQNLSSEEIKKALKSIVDGEASDAQIGAFIMGTRMKGETAEEIAGAAKFFREHSTKLNVDNPEGLVDTCGTGGDRSGTFNVSTTVAFVLAGAGVRVAKHGNRSVSSKSGSADLLEFLGAKIDLGPEQVKRMIEEIGIGFMFAPIFHPAMKRVVGPRKEVGIRSIFNLVGPLSNPAGAKRQLLGVFSDEYLEKIAYALSALDIVNGVIVHGRDGIDEVSISAPTLIAHIKDKDITIYDFVPEDMGFKRYPIEYVSVNSVEESAKTSLSVLRGEPSPALDMVVLNAMFGILVSGKTDDMKEALEIVRESIHTGKAYKKLQDFIHLSKTV